MTKKETTISDPEGILAAWNRATIEFKLCPNRVWAVGKESLPALLPPSGTQLPRHDAHGLCTVDFCEHSQRDFTGVSQRHECGRNDGEEDSCRRLEGLFWEGALAKAAIAGRSTVWALNGKALLEGHTWRFHTSGLTGRAPGRGPRRIAKDFHCEGLWWDTICIPREKAARAQAIRRIQKNYQDARITLVHDCFLRNWEWRDGCEEAACFAILMSPWFSRAWTALELAKSRRVKIIFRGQQVEGGRPLIVKDLDEEILARDAERASGPHGEVTRIIRAFRNGVTTVDDLLIALGHRYTSWPKDRAIVSGLLVGVDVVPIPPKHDVWQQDIYEAILKKIGKVAHAHLFHNKATMPKACWCPTSLFSMPEAGAKASLRITEELDLIGTWTLVPADYLPKDRFVWGPVHPLIKKTMEICLLNPEKCLLLAEPGRIVVERALLVKAMVKRHSPAILCYKYIGAVYLHPPMSMEAVCVDSNGARKMEVILLGNPDEAAEPEHDWKHLQTHRLADDIASDIGEFYFNNPHVTDSGTPNNWTTALMGDDEHAKVFLNAVQPLDREPVSQRTPLHYAVWRGYSDTVRHLASSTNLDALDRLRQNPLHIAAERGDPGIVSQLLAVAHNVNKTMGLLAARGYKGQIPLHYAARADAAGIAKLLIEKGADVNAEDNDRFTPLHLAAEIGSQSICALLLQTGKVDIDANSKNGWSPLHLALMGQRSLVTEWLIRKGANTQAQDRLGWSSLHYAAETGSAQAAALLLQHGAEVNSHDEYIGWTPLHFAAIMGWQEVVELLLCNGAHADLKDKDGWTPLQFAMLQGYNSISQLLVQHGADAREISPDAIVTWTPLNLTALDTEQGLIKLLLEDSSKADRNSAGGRDGTPLHWVAQTGQYKAAKVLWSGPLLVNADTHLTMADSRSALHCAAEGGHTEVVKLFIDVGFDVNAEDRWGRTVIHFAARGGDVPTLRLLLDAGAQPNQPFGLEDYWPPLVMAARYGHREVAQILINKGADVNGTPPFTHHALAEAALYGHEDMVALLFANGASAHVLSYFGQTALYCAIKGGHVAVASLLLGQGAFVDVPSTTDDKEDSWTPLHLAASVGNVELVRLLVEKGADSSITDWKDRSPLDVAERYGHTEVANMLRNRG
ncbi:ankyrin repeat domain-containing protein [Aspergillus mulundensis]|uniref:Uncharacterized protein n=1 Tax=Aspergillus mulundensis TaxID=1810919 RepID=A0A3D8QVK9_9EURO|nr:hypothetical protein DSM5745_09554 [Aspergillus mulundensis]RDW65815.1 hypothetical protein DSM5745_09554 [Aspergillus mulundensis]